MERSLNIAVIGNGNVAHHLSRWFVDGGHHINSIYSRSKTGEQFRNSLNYEGEPNDIILIAVKDDALGSVASQLKNTGDAILLHTSGTVPLKILKDHRRFGILYPLQTLQKNREISLDRVPFLIEGNNNNSLEAIAKLCRSCQMHYSEVSSADRKLYHLSAVIGSNFSNYLLHIAQKKLQSSGLDATILRPLIEETVAKAFDNGAFESQTGPARRNDTATIRQHLEMLEDKDHREIYRLMSESIISEYHDR